LPQVVAQRHEVSDDDEDGEAMPPLVVEQMP